MAGLKLKIVTRVIKIKMWQKLNGSDVRQSEGDSGREIDTAGVFNDLRCGRRADWKSALYREE